MKIKTLISIFFLLVTLAACTPATDENLTTNDQPDASQAEPAPDNPVSSDDTAVRPEPTTEIKEDTVIKEAALNGMQVLILESFPVQINVQVSGILSDGCTSFGPVQVEQVKDTFYVTVQTTRPADRMCTQVVSFFEETISLDVLGLPAGKYTVDVNGLTDTFELSVDNVAPSENN